LSRKDLENFAILRIDVTIGFSVSVCCEGTNTKWTELDGEMASNLVLILNRRNFNKCAQQGSAAAILFHGQVVFCDIHSDCEPKVFAVGQYNICSLTGGIGQQ
jgi:hypothetical protein